jgi:hypothetical protein
MPARAPLVNRVEVSNCFFPFEVNHWGECHPLRQSDSTETHLFELLICCELNGTVRYDSNTIDPIPSHEPPEPLLFPHAYETSPHARVLLAAVPGLNLSASAGQTYESTIPEVYVLNDFEPLQRRYHSPRRRTSDSTGDEIR